MGLFLLGQGLDGARDLERSCPVKIRPCHPYDPLYDEGMRWLRVNFLCCFVTVQPPNRGRYILYLKNESRLIFLVWRRTMTIGVTG